MVSTKYGDARVITNTTYTNDDKGVPIYWAGGSKVADDYEDFYDGSWDDETNVRDANGALITAPARVWTGSASDGTELMVDGVSHALGQPQAGYGTPGAGPLHSGSTANTEEYPLYGLSVVFRIVAPGAFSNLGQSGTSTDERSARRSQRFTTGANLHGYEDVGVQIAYRGVANRDGYDLSIYTVDTSGHPDTKVVDITYPDADSGQELTFDSPDNLVLAPNTTYAIVVTPDNATDEVGLRATTSDDEDDEGEDDWSISDAFDIESGGSWSADTDGRSLKIRVRGTAEGRPSRQAHRPDRQRRGPQPHQPVLDRPVDGRRLGHQRLPGRVLRGWQHGLDRPRRRHRVHDNLLFAHRAPPEHHALLPRLRHQRGGHVRRL